MTAKLLDGKAFAKTIRDKVAEHVTRIKNEVGVTPGLAVVLVGEDPASQVYVRSKGKQTVEAGMNSFEHKLEADTCEEELLGVIDTLNKDPAVHGILVQLPLPKHLNEDLVINAIDPAKDVDGFHIANVGLLSTGQKFGPMHTLADAIERSPWITGRTPSSLAAPTLLESPALFFLPTVAQ